MDERLSVGAMMNGGAVLHRRGRDGADGLGGGRTVRAEPSAGGPSGRLLRRPAGARRTRRRLRGPRGDTVPAQRAGPCARAAHGHGPPRGAGPPRGGRDDGGTQRRAAGHRPGTGG
ncbi:hypothetical protein LT493_04065 [Streptomyces tricolor]|nr:hypothetical protein [Streptomyces tricolor]